MRELRVKFKNTKALNQIDWDSEIVNPGVTNMTEDELGKIASRAVMRYQLALMYLGKGIEELETYRQANTLRILQYFYGLFIYYHGVFYNKSEESNVKDFTPDMKDLMKKYGKLDRSELPLEKIIKEVLLPENLDDFIKYNTYSTPSCTIAPWSLSPDVLAIVGSTTSRPHFLNNFCSSTKPPSGNCLRSSLSWLSSISSNTAWTYFASFSVEEAEQYHKEESIRVQEKYHPIEDLIPKYSERDMIAFGKHCIRQFTLFQNRDEDYTKRLLVDWKPEEKTCYCGKPIDYSNTDCVEFSLKDHSMDA